MMRHSNSGKQKEMSKSTNCHQCHKNNKGRVVHCRRCGRKQYCVRCIKNRYATMTEAFFAEACPACRGICNCWECQKPKPSLVGTSCFMGKSRALPANNHQGDMLPPKEDNAQGLIAAASKTGKIVEIKSPGHITGSSSSSVPRDSELYREDLRKFEILDEFEKLLIPIFGKPNNS